MNWITTNLRLPEDVYMDLKMQAARRRKSVAAIIREKITQPSDMKNATSLLAELQAISNNIVKTAKKKNLSQTLIKSRYEHA